MGADENYYLEAAAKAAYALKTLNEWTRGGNVQPFDRVKDVAKFLVDGKDVHPEVMVDVDLKDRQLFREAILFLARPTSFSRGTGNVAITNALVAIQQVSEALAARKANAPAAQLSSPVANRTESFVNLARIEDLKSLSPASLDLGRLIRLLEELNAVYEAECYMATIMIGRAIIDHVPPVFGFVTFAQVLANYSGGKSFKDTIEHLEKQLRKIADAQLHSPMRKPESLITKQAAAFQPAFDVLVAEVIRVLKA